MPEISDEEYRRLTAPVRKELAAFIGACLQAMPEMKKNVADLKESVRAAFRKFIDEHDKLCSPIHKSAKAVEREGRKLEAKIDEINEEPGQALDEIQSVGAFTGAVGQSIGAIDGGNEMSDYKDKLEELFETPDSYEEILEVDYIDPAKELMKALAD